MSQFYDGTQVSQKTKATEQHLLEAKRHIYGSTQLGIETLESLRTQSEKLDATEKHLEDTDYLIAQSVRTLRGMTWSGTFYNACSDVSSMFSAPATRSDQLSKEYESNASSTTSEKRPSLVELSNSMPLYSKQTQKTSDTLAKSKLDQDLDEISHALESLQAIGVNLNEQLGHQNEQLDRIESSADRLNDKTLAVTLRTTKVSNRTSHDPGTCIGAYQFIATDNNMLLLGVDGECVVLTNSADTATVFDVYLRYETVVGLCNKRTGKFIGKTMWGGISAAGMYFGSMEEWYFDFQAEQSGLLCLSKNWGAGGWLKEPTAEHLREDQAGIVRHIVDNTTISVRDRSHCVLFRAISCGPPPNK